MARGFSFYRSLNKCEALFLMINFTSVSVTVRKKKLIFIDIVNLIMYETNTDLGMERAMTAFEYAKRGGTGELSKREYKVAMTALFGHCPDNWEIKQVFQNCHGQTVSFAEFLHWAREKGFSNDSFIDAKTLFMLLDKDFKGRLTITDFYSAAEETGLRVSKSVWQRAFNEIDRRKKGFLDLDELTILMDDNIHTLTH